MFFSGAETRHLVQPRGAPRSGLACHRRNGYTVRARTDVGAVADSSHARGTEWQPHFVDHHSGGGRGGDFGSGCLEDFRRFEDPPYPLRTADSWRGGTGRYRAVAGAGIGNGDGWEDRTQPAANVVSPDYHYRVLCARD